MAKRNPSRRTHTIVIQDTEDFEAFIADLLYDGFSRWVMSEGVDCFRPALPCAGDERQCPVHRAAKRTAKQPIPLRAAMSWLEWKRVLTPALRMFWERYTERDGQWRHPTKRNAQDRVHAMIERALAAYDPATRERLSQNAIAELVVPRVPYQLDAVKKYTRQWRLLQRYYAGLPLSSTDRAFLRRHPLLQKKYGSQP